MPEIWRPAPDGRRRLALNGRYSEEDGYYVSNLGRVKSVKGGKETILKQSVGTDGYLKVDLHVGGMRVTKHVHQLVARTHVPNPGNKPQVNHKDGNKRNNRADNLEWVTDSENKKHAYRMGLMKWNGKIPRPTYYLTAQRDERGRFKPLPLAPLPSVAIPDCSPHCGTECQRALI